MGCHAPTVGVHSKPQPLLAIHRTSSDTSPYPEASLYDGLSGLVFLGRLGTFRANGCAPSMSSVQYMRLGLFTWTGTLTLGCIPGSDASVAFDGTQPAAAAVWSAALCVADPLAASISLCLAARLVIE